MLYIVLSLKFFILIKQKKSNVQENNQVLFMPIDSMLFLIQTCCFSAVFIFYDVIIILTLETGFCACTHTHTHSNDDIVHRISPLTSILKSQKT